LTPAQAQETIRKKQFKDGEMMRNLGTLSRRPSSAATSNFPEITQGIVRAVIGAAAFAGLREGEIRGQWWEDDDGEVLNIRRSVSRSHVKYETKTHEDEEDPGIVPIIDSLRLVLDAIKPENASGWMFPNTIGGALDLGQPR
jgi:hypothetical protein